MVQAQARVCLPDCEGNRGAQIDGQACDSCAPALDEAFEDAEEDVGVEAALVRLIEYDDRVAAQLVVLQHLP